MALKTRGHVQMTGYTPDDSCRPKETPLSHNLMPKQTHQWDVSIGVPTSVGLVLFFS